MTHSSYHRSRPVFRHHIQLWLDTQEKLSRSLKWHIVPCILVDLYYLLSHCKPLLVQVQTLLYPHHPFECRGQTSVQTGCAGQLINRARAVQNVWDRRSRSVNFLLYSFSLFLECLRIGRDLGGAQPGDRRAGCHPSVCVRKVLPCLHL